MNVEVRMLRALVVIVGLLVSLSADARSRLVVESDRPVVIIVNGLPHPIAASGGEVSIDLGRGSEGYQNVKVVSMLGDQRYKGRVMVPPNTVVRYAWQGRDFKMVSQRRLSGAGGSGNSTKPVRGSAPVPPPSEGLPLDDVYLMAVRDVLEYEARSGERVEPPMK
jgi:hypothetical protein